MSKATFVPAQTETKTIEVAPAKVTLELTVEQAQALLALVGCTCGTTLLPVYAALRDLHGTSQITRKRLPSEVRRNLPRINEDAVVDY